MNKRVIGLTLAALLSGCATTQITGDTVANDQLQQDTMKLLLPYAQAKLACNSIETVQTSSISVSPEGVVIERWRLSGCANEFGVQVKFTPSASGGVGINITPGE